MSVKIIGVCCHIDGHLMLLTGNVYMILKGNLRHQNHYATREIKFQLNDLRIDLMKLGKVNYTQSTQNKQNN
jgi:hypothetical protein